MWSNISKDLSELAQNLRSESIDLMGKLGHIAAEVVGHGGVYAGDEQSPAAKEGPLSTEELVTFQETTATYTEPLSESERAVFAAWAEVSPYSSLHARTAQGGAEADSRPRNAQWPDEPTTTSRQRLLDYSESVLLMYRDLVGEAVSPRSPQPGQSPATATAASAATSTPVHGTEADATPVEETPAQSDPTTTPVRRPAQRLLREDEFFDRYFFRLAQLRAARASALETQRQQQRAAAAAEAHAQSQDAARSPARGEAPEGVPLFAKKMLSAATELVANFDAAMHFDHSTGRDPMSDEDNILPADAAARDGQATRQQQWQHIASLEELVQELQAALRKEKAHTSQLEALLREKGLAVPPPPETPVPTPVKPLTTTSSTATASAEVTPAHRDPAAAAPPAALAGEALTRSTSNLSGLAEDDDWEKVSPQE